MDACLQQANKQEAKNLAIKQQLEQMKSVKASKIFKSLEEEVKYENQSIYSDTKQMMN